MKKILLGIVVGLVIASGIGVVAYNYNASSIEYTPSDSTWSVNNVSDALDELLSDKDKISDDLTVEVVGQYSFVSDSITINNVTNYKYYSVISGYWTSSGATSNEMLGYINVTSTDNATFKEIASTSSTKDTSGVASRTFIIYPDGSGEDITVHFNRADSISIYGIK